MKFAASLIFAAALSLSGCSSDSTQLPHPTETVMTLKSANSFAATETRLREALAARNLKLFTVVDHGAGARSIGEDIGQSKLFIFGNPKAGTPLMQSNPKLGLALPLKILLLGNDGDVHLHRTDIAAIVRGYGVTDQTERLAKISATLDAIMAEATGA